MKWRMMGSRPVSQLAIDVMASSGFTFTSNGWKETKKLTNEKAKRVKKRHT